MEKDKELVDADGEEVEASEPPEVALAREEVNLLLTEQQKTAALKVRERDSALSHRNGAYYRSQGLRRSSVDRGLFSKHPVQGSPATGLVPDPVIQALGKQRRVDQKFKVILGQPGRVRLWVGTS